MGFKNSTKALLQELSHVLDNIDSSEIEEAINLITKSNKIFFNALGRAGFMGKSFVMRLMHMGREVYVVGETNTPNFEEEDVLIICSGSGETKQFIDIASKAQNLGGKILVFTGNANSTLANMADAQITIKAPSKKKEDGEFFSCQPMASLFEQAILLVGDSIVLTMMNNATDNQEMFSRHSNLE